MSDQGLIYIYDGTFEGYLCAVLAALRSGRVPDAICGMSGTCGMEDAVNIRTDPYTVKRRIFWGVSKRWIKRAKSTIY